MKKILFIVNHVHEIRKEQSTAELAYGFAQRGHQVWIAGANELAWGEENIPLAWAHVSTFHEDITHWLEQLKQKKEKVFFPQLDLIMIRTNPGRDKNRSWAHDVVLDLSTWAQKNGLVVLNPPEMLRKSSSKMYLQDFPQDIRPRSIISRHKQDIKDFVFAQQNPCILKPLRGTGGSNVFIIRPSDYSNLNQIIEVVSANDFIIAQEYIPQAEVGDTRVLMLQGEPIVIGGKLAAVMRLRQGEDLRSNVSVGGKASEPQDIQNIYDIIDKVKPKLKEDGVFLAGLDVIGHKIVEVNVFSPGGIRDAGFFAQRDFLSMILDKAEDYLL